MTWVLENLPVILGYLLAHLGQVLPALAACLILAIPIAGLARSARPLRIVLVSGFSLLYAVPSLALFVILPIILATGIRDVTNVVVALTLYGLALLVPATVDALDAVEHRVLDAATAMGMGRARRFWTVELPLAGPAILTGLRVVAVSTVSLTTVGAVLGVRSLGRLFTDGFQRGLLAEIVTGLVLTVALALLLDGAILLAGRLVLPWTRGRAAEPADPGQDNGSAGPGPGGHSEPGGLSAAEQRSETRAGLGAVREGQS
ncbi:ABC transporter permease [Actinomyces slackii]|uniref:Osmoprotectant uptake system permease protein yehY n=1 Tax=Actinomyces slackii TaxID=52774 RepID=A0A3S4U260_9ACTO|nr:ABC transporter permease subunit [Actinomyces slackii]VEG74644.1 Putative osmoprotectant uptake system permease protein yehY [Actinomyces slackii]